VNGTCFLSERGGQGASGKQIFGGKMQVSRLRGIRRQSLVNLWDWSKIFRKFLVKIRSAVPYPFVQVNDPQQTMTQHFKIVPQPIFC
jgi:hypothetical protein